MRSNDTKAREECLANHAGFYDLTGKRARRNDSGPNPFVVRGELARYLDNAWAGLAKQEQEQRPAKQAAL